MDDAFRVGGRGLLRKNKVEYRGKAPATYLGGLLLARTLATGQEEKKELGGRAKGSREKGGQKRLAGSESMDVLA